DWTGLDARIKWPNDVRVGGRKVAGVLVERGPGAVVGIGLNADVAADDFPPGLRDTATSLRILGGEPVDRSEPARAPIIRLDHWYDRGLAGGPETLNGPWRDRCEHLGQMVRVITPTGPVVGRLDDLDLIRGLTLVAPDGLRPRIATRDVLDLAPHDPA